MVDDCEPKEKLAVCDLCHNTAICKPYFKTDLGREMMEAIGIEDRYGNYYCKHRCWNVIRGLSLLMEQFELKKWRKHAGRHRQGD